MSTRQNIALDVAVVAIGILVLAAVLYHQQVVTRHSVRSPSYLNVAPPHRDLYTAPSHENLYPGQSFKDVDTTHFDKELAMIFPPASQSTEARSTHDGRDVDTARSDKELDPNLMATIFPRSKSIEPRSTYVASEAEKNGSGRISVKSKSVKSPPIPKDWESFDKQYAPVPKIGNPIVTLLENGTYQVDELLYSIKLLEKQLNLEYRLNNLVDYDPRTRANAFDTFLDQTTMKTDVQIDSPIGAYVGVRVVMKFW